MKKYLAVDEKAIIDSSVPNSPSDSEIDSVKIINYSHHFSPYKSDLDRVISEEVKIFEFVVNSY